jgi:hypothetical protein
MRVAEIDLLKESWKEVSKALSRLQYALYEVDKIIGREELKNKDKPTSVSNGE